MARLNKSSARIALPTFDPDAMIDLIGQFAKTDKRFIPEYGSLVDLRRTPTDKP
jgi:branched-chain amino acid aminotransferase